jgi:hypothetical protein
MSRAVWQVSGGPPSRAYAEVFLWHGVALIGPGDAGPWNTERDDGEFEGLGAGVEGALDQAKRRP